MEAPDALENLNMNYLDLTNPDIRKAIKPFAFTHSWRACYFNKPNSDSPDLISFERILLPVLNCISTNKIN